MGAETGDGWSNRLIFVNVEKYRSVCMDCSASGTGYVNIRKITTCRPAILEESLNRIPTYGEAAAKKIDMSGVPTRECHNGYKSPNDRLIS